MAKDDDLRAIARGLRQLPETVERLKNELDALQAISRERSEEMSIQFDRLETAMEQANYSLLMVLDALLLKRNQRQTRRLTQELRERVIPERIESKKLQLTRQYDYLNQLEERSADYGPVPPIDLLNQIKEQKKTIERTEQEIKDLENVQTS